MKHVYILEHRTWPIPDRGQLHLAERGFEVRRIATFKGDAVSELSPDTAGVVIMGGPQYVSHLDEFPYLRGEIDLAGRTMDAGVPLLGICLGGQIIAAHLGAAIDFHPDGKVAYGYYPLRPTEVGQGFAPEGLHVPAGNAQGFDPPPGAELLAEGEPFPNQAFRVNEKTYGFQFHPEINRAMLDQWQIKFADNHGKPGAQSRETQDDLHAAHDGALHGWFTGFLDRLFGTANSRL